MKVKDSGEKTSHIYTVGEFKKTVKELFDVNEEVMSSFEKYGKSYVKSLSREQEKKIFRFFFETKSVNLDKPK